MRTPSSVRSTFNNPPPAGTSPDDLFRSTKEIQDVTNAVNEELAKLADAKKAEITAAGGGGSE